MESAATIYALSERFDRQCENVADAAFSPNRLRSTWISLQFAPQPQHLHGDAVIENVLVHSGGLQQILARQRPLGGLKKGQQQRILNNTLSLTYTVAHCSINSEAVMCDMRAKQVTG